MPMTTLLAVNQFFMTYHEELGSGGLGRVNRVRITESTAAGIPVGSDWAAKRLNARWHAEPAARERFEREINALSRMSHENIVACVGVSLEGYERFYMMPLYRQSVRKLMAAGGNRNDWKVIATYGAILAEALSYAHQLGFVHRDIKPDNLLFNPGGRLTIADWGIGYFIHQHSVVLQQLTRGGMGTAYYCSAEQWATGKCDGRGDIYSLGMTLDEWHTGQQRTIQIGEGLSRLGRIIGTPGALAFRALLVQMTAPYASARPANMAIVAQELRRIAALT